MRSPNTIPRAIILAGVIIASAVYFTVREEAPKAPGNGSPALVRAVGMDDHILGNPAAPIKIIVYSDFDCDFCKDFHQAMRVVLAKAGPEGDIAWVYRSFPLTELHPNAFKHAQAAECVARVGGGDAFWKFADSMFTKQPVDPRDYGALAQAAGVPGDTFAACYSNPPREIDERIRADRENALAAGAVGTPYSILLAPGKQPVVMDGAYTTTAIELLLDQARTK